MKIILHERELLKESLPDIGDDVNLLYNIYFKKELEKVKRTGKVSKDSFKYAKTDTSILRSKDAKKAHELNPCTILINNYLGNYGNYYQPSTSTISFGVGKAAFKLSKQISGNISVAGEHIPKNQIPSFFNEFTEERIKGAIHHELIHWIDDTFHNRRVSKDLFYLKHRGEEEYLKGRAVNSAFFEIEAQMGNIIELKKKYSSHWDYISFDDMISLDRILEYVSRNLNDKQVIQWKRNLKERMAREGLLGKKMR